MNYSEFFQQAAIACLAPLSVADKCHPKHGAALAAEYAEALADELVKRGHLQPPVKRVQAEPEPLPEARKEITTADLQPGAQVSIQFDYTYYITKVKDGILYWNTPGVGGGYEPVEQFLDAMNKKNATVAPPAEPEQFADIMIRGSIREKPILGIDPDQHALPEPATATTCASCLHFQPGDVCSKHDITTTYDYTCPSHE